MKSLLAFYCILALGYNVFVKIFELLFPIYRLYLQVRCKRLVYMLQLTFNGWYQNHHGCCIELLIL